MEVKIISRETIKPSSPTTQHLRTFKLSIFDQLVPMVYNPLVFFYTNGNSDDHLKTDDKLARLKHSLSDALTVFYPLAGRIKDQRSIECNDEGVLYLEAQASHEMIEFLNPPKTESLSHLIPCHPICKEPPELATQLAIQVNFFTCGGIAISVCVLHKIIDASTLGSFVQKWAAISRGDGNKVAAHVHNILPSLFPANDRLAIQALTWRPGDSSPKQSNKRTSKSFVFEPSDTRRLLFDAPAISRLKAKARSENVPNPSRTEAIVGFIWKSVMSASKVLSKPQSPSVVLHAITLRSRLSPPLPDNTIGNMTWRGVARYNPTASTDDPEAADFELHHHLVHLLRRSVEKVDADYVNKLQGEEGHDRFSEIRGEVAEIYSSIEPDLLFEVSSVIRMGFYETNFGWGRPVWCGFVLFREILNKNCILLMEGSRGDEVEAWLVLDKHQMAVVEQDPEFLSHVTMNPAVL